MTVAFSETQTLFSGPSTIIARLAANHERVYVVCKEEGVGLDPDVRRYQSADEHTDAMINARSTIKYRISNDYGLTFDDPAILYECNIAQNLPPLIDVSSTSDRVTLAWGDMNKDATDSHVFLSMSRDDGSGFEDPEIINTTDPERTADSPEPRKTFRSAFEEGRFEMFRRWYLVPRVKLSVAGDNVYVFWSETKGRFQEDVEYRLFFRASNDGGRTFGSKMQVGSTTIKASEFMRMFQINLTASGSEVYMMWVQFTPVPGYMFSGKPNPLEAYLITSRDAGKTLGRTINLSEDTSVVKQGGQEAMDGSTGGSGHTGRDVFEKLPFEISAAGNGELYMVLIGHESYGQQDIIDSLLHSIPMTGGKMNQFSRPPNPNPLNINLPVYLAKSSDYGQSFASTLHLAEYSAGIDDTYLLASGKNVHVIWRTAAQNEVFLSRTSMDKGYSFQPIVHVPEIRIFHPSGSPSNSGTIIAAPDGRMLVAMRHDIQSSSPDPTSVSSEIFFLASSVSGSTFVETKRLTDPIVGGVPRAAAFPSIVASDGKHVYVAWSEMQEGSPASVKFREGIIE